MKKMRSAILVVTVLAAMVVAAGCGGTSHEQDIRAAADGFLSSIESGDFTAAKEYCTEDVLGEFGSPDASITEELDRLYEALGVSKDSLDETTQKAISDATTKVLDELVTGYEITQVTEDDNKGTVTAQVTYGFDLDSMDSDEVTDQVLTISQEYMTEHQDELMELYQSGGEDALMKEIISKMMPEMLDTYLDALKKTGETKETVQMTVENVDNKWTVTSAETQEQED